MLVVVGGHTRNIGKTSVAAGLISRLRDFSWVAVKITQYGHGVCSRNGLPCGCEADPECGFSLSEEHGPGDSDSARFLAAGARRSFWLRTPAGQLSAAAPALRELVDNNPSVIMESNSVLDLMRPDLFLMVLDFANADFKQSSLRHMERADAYIVVDRPMVIDPLVAAPAGIWDGRPQFRITPPEYATPEMADFVRQWGRRV